MIGKIFKIIINTILFLLVILGIFVVFSFVPFPGNYKIFTVQSGSMEPTIHTGSLIFVRPVADYKTGDIITKRTTDPKVTVTHRIAEINQGENGNVSYKTKGDANNAEDMETTLKKDIVGKALFSLSYLGYPVSYAKTVQGLILLIVIPAVIIIYDEMNKIRAEIGKKIDYRNRVKKREENEEKTEEKI